MTVDDAYNQVMDGKEVIELLAEHNWVRVTTDAGKILAICLSLARPTRK